MPKRKRHPRLCNSYGSIRYLGKGRRNPYAVHPPATERDEHGNYIRPKALCYVDDWYVGFAVLTAYHAGTYTPGDELTLKSQRMASHGDLDAFCNRIITDYEANTRVMEKRKETEKTFAEIYDLFFDWKYGEHAPKKLSKQSMNSTQAAFKNCSLLHDRIFRDLKLEDLQGVIDSCTLKQASVENMVSLMKQMYKYAEPRELCDKNYAQYVQMPDMDGDEHGVPFSDDDLKILWDNKDNPTVEMILIMCYSGFRITAYLDIKVDMNDWYFQGGVKTAAGKNRIVPIHSAIQELVFARMERLGCLMVKPTQRFRNAMYDALTALGIERHTPHDCRHTFSRLCESYGVNEADRKRMLGHSFGNDITNGIYGHRTLEELRGEIEKIKKP